MLSNSRRLSQIEEKQYIYEEEPVGSFLGQHIISTIENRDRIDVHAKLRKSMKIGVILLSATAKVPYWVISMKLGKIIGPVSAVANTVAFFILETWAGRQTIDNELRPKTIAELSLFGDKKVRHIIVITSLSFLIAAASQLPTALAAMKYNSPALKIAAAIILVISNSLFPLRSIQLSLEAIGRQSIRDVESKLNNLKSKILDLLFSKISQLKNSNACEWVKVLQEIQYTEDVRIKKRKYYSILFKDNIDQTPSETTGRQIRKVGEVVGFILNIFLQYSLGAYTYAASKEELDDSDGLGISLAIVAVASNIYLMGKSIQKTMGKIFESVQKWLTGNKAPSLIEQMRPRATFMITSVGILLDILALGPTIVIWSDYYDRNRSEKYLLTSLMCLSIFTLLMTAMLDTLEDIVENWVVFNGTQLEKEALMLNGKFKSLAEAIKNTPHNHFAVFMLDLPEEIRSPLLRQFNISLEEVKRFTDFLSSENSSTPLLETIRTGVVT